MNELNFLLTSVGRRSYLVKYFKQALNGNGKVFVANSSSQNPAFQVADGSVVTPLIYDDEYIPFLLKYCREKRICAIISLFDIDLPILAKHKELFKENGVNVIVSDYDVIKICNDKYLTYNFLKQNNLNVPRTYIDIDKAKRDIKSEKLNFPVFVKPRWGMGSISVFEASDIDELEVFYRKVKRELKDSYLKYESAIDIDNAVLIQEKLKGQEFGLDVINDLYGKYQNTIVKKKLAMRSGETDCAVTVDNDNLSRIGEKLSILLKHIANLDVDVFMVDEEPYILEMNARFGGGYPFSHMAGVNLPKAIIEWLKGNNVENLLEAKSMVMCQKDIDLVYLNQKNFEYKKIDNAKLYNALKNLQNHITPTLLERGINIEEYAEKLSTFGTSVAAYVNGDICGVISGYLNKNIGYISIFIVNKEFQGLNIGKELLKQFEFEAKNNGIKVLKLEVRKNNKAAIGFYEHFSFNIVSNASNESYYMEKKL